jgi:organic radical activating enzyme
MKVFGWDLCHRCNYRCPYCGIWNDAPEKDVILPPEEWAKIWNRIYDMYGRVKIFVSGGEPGVYPNFYELIKVLSKNHFPEICTNLSWDVTKLIDTLTPKDFAIAATFHPSYAKFDEFFQKAVKVRDYLPDNQIYYVAFPNQIKDMPARSQKLAAQGIKLIPLPLRGDGFALNNEEEKKIIADLSPYKGTEKIDYQLQNISPKGKLCRAGKDYAVIRVDSTIDRCSQYHTGEVGKITDLNFTLFDAPKECQKDFCPIESQWIVD